MQWHSVICAGLLCQAAQTLPEPFPAEHCAGSICTVMVHCMCAALTESWTHPTNQDQASHICCEEFWGEPASVPVAAEAAEEVKAWAFYHPNNLLLLQRNS